FQPDGSLIPNPARRLEPIQVSLDPAFFTKIDDFEQRFVHGVPSLIDCEALTIKGDVYFEKGVVIKGRVNIRNTGSTPAIIRSGTVLEADLRL
ncbi:MAG: UTP--glucose-1-phosphate uridylyltransferase, partial [Desulfosarcina sp.]